MNKLATTSLSLAISCACFAGCGGNPQADAEKTVMSFIGAFQGGDYDKAGKLLYLESSNDSEAWLAYKADAKMQKEGKVDDINGLGAANILLWNLKPFHSEKAKDLQDAMVPDEESKAEMAVNDVSDMRFVLLEATPTPELAQRLGENGTKSALVGMLAVKHKGTWKTSIQLVPVDAKPDDLR